MASHTNITEIGHGSALRAFAAALLGTIVLVLLTATPGEGQAAGPDPGCPNQDLRPGQLSRDEQRQAITCLIAFERKQAGRRALKRNRALRRVASRHNAVMLKTECFRHRCPGERPLARRLEASAYLSPGDRYGFGENIGCAQTPRAQVNAWMGSRSHRHNVLGKRFRHIGVGAGRGAPNEARPDCRDRGYATYTVIFAWRER